MRPFPDVNAGKWQVSTSGGTQPVWSRNGGELFFVDDAGSLLAVRVQSGTPPVFSPPSIILEALLTSLAPGPGRLYDVSPDWRRFLVVRDVPAEMNASVPRLTLVLNWPLGISRDAGR